MILVIMRQCVFFDIIVDRGVIIFNYVLSSIVVELVVVVFDQFI